MYVLCTFLEIGVKREIVSGGAALTFFIPGHPTIDSLQEILEGWIYRRNTFRWLTLTIDDEVPVFIVILQEKIVHVRILLQI
jgi:hypothetical protein